MDFVIPYSKELKFNTKISEIESISLEHEETFNDTEILGNFIVSGEYKTHELSKNREVFNYTIPFSIDIPDNIIRETIDIEITDFTYELKDDNILKVIIELTLKAKEKEEREVILDQIKKDEEVFIEPKEEIKEERNEEIITTKEEQITTSSQEEYLTYHIHLVKEGETIESICQKYKITSDKLLSYNDEKDLKELKKLIIPCEDE